MAKAIMIQGTTSSAGKSLITAGLCRVFAQDGLRAAPFKSQNMALNSFITSEGLEMGRAQVMQAEAAGIEPSVLMNPILLKPTNDTGSQVIVNGEPVGAMSAADYFKYKRGLVPVVAKAYAGLASMYDVIVIEGAGSPAEINLKSEDIVNMGMAKLARAPVFIVGDIDRGGVFASLYGTVMLLDPDERELVKGTIVNKFRGDIGILRPGLAELERLTRVPVAGVVPYMRIDVDDEDSLSPRLERPRAFGALEISVIRLPRISNFTDYNALERMSGVAVNYVGTAEELKSQNPGMIIIPGTKNTMGDLLWMRQNGLEALIKRAAAQGTPVMGICGGYQMLSRELADPDGAEGGGSMLGMGLIPATVEFQTQKVRTRVKGRAGRLEGLFAPLEGAAFEGYEIHMGRTTLAEGVQPFSTLSDGSHERPDGAAAGNVLGSYVHGIFDSGDFAERLVGLLMDAKGIEQGDRQAMDFHSHKQRQYDMLADGLRASLDMKLIYKVLEDGAHGGGNYA